ncbi:hypothetical protein B0H13DRAFT_1918262 [Mycena leptocephala]|nr:hypothetical protein B0H13DRAFT_1918262 [Mycena leptocephala]
MRSIDCQSFGIFEEMLGVPKFWVYIYIDQTTDVDRLAHDAHASRMLVTHLNNLDVSAISWIEMTLETYSTTVQWSTASDDIFRIPILFGGQAPSLTYLAFSSMFVIWGGSSLFFNVTTFHLEGVWEELSPTVEGFFTLLHAMPSLAKLFIINVECCEFDGYTSSPPVLRALTHLYLNVQDDISSCVFSLMELPVLHTLHIALGDEDQVHPFLHYFENITSHVTTLMMDMKIVSSFPKIRQEKGG